MAFRLRFDDADGFGVGIEQIVNIAGGERELTDSDTQPRRDVHLAIVLHRPAALVKLAVDFLAGFFFGSHAPLPDKQPRLQKP